MEPRKTPWDLWVALGLIALILLGEAYHFLAHPAAWKVRPWEQMAFHLALDGAIASLAVGLFLRHAWAWWLSFAGFSLLAVVGSYHSWTLLEMLGPGALRSPHLLRSLAIPLVPLAIAALLVSCRLRGAYPKRKRAA